MNHTIHYLDTYPPSNASHETVERTIVIQNDYDLFVQAEKLKLDILHLHTSVSVKPPSYIPVIRTVHTHNPYCPSGNRYLKRWSQPCDRAYTLEGCLWGHVVDRCGSVRPHKLYTEFQKTWEDLDNLGDVTIMANSQFVKEQMVRSGYLADNIYVLRLPAPEITEYFSPPLGNVPHFVFLGRIAPEKGWDWLLRSLAEVKVPVHLDIAGSGNPEQEQAIWHLAECLGVSKKITFHGWVDEAKAIQLIHKARALVFPSLWHEPAGLVSLEAAAVGRPIIASKVGGIPEYADLLKNALLVEPNHIRGLARSIEQLATNWNLAKQMGIQGRKMAQKFFSLEKHQKGLLGLYEIAIDKARDDIS